MPTAYTKDLTPTTPLYDFILTCAQHMAPCISLKDRPAREIPEFTVAPHFLEQVDEWTTYIKHFEDMPVAAAELECVRQFQNKMERWQAAKAEREQNTLAFNRMLGLVKTWTPPSAEHEPLKRFMLEQLVDGIEYECQPYAAAIPVQETAEAFKLREVKYGRYNLESAQTHLSQEQARVAKNNEWVKTLQRMLGNSPGDVVQSSPSP